MRTFIFKTFSAEQTDLVWVDNPCWDDEAGLLLTLQSCLLMPLMLDFSHGEKQDDLELFRTEER